MMKEAAYENDCQNRNNNQYLRRRANGAVAHCRRSIHGEIGAGITAQSTMPRQHTLHQSFKRRILGLTGLVLVASGERLPAGRDPPANQINLAGQDHSGRQSVPRLHQSCRCAARCALLRPAALTERFTVTGSVPAPLRCFSVLRGISRSARGLAGHSSTPGTPQPERSRHARIPDIESNSIGRLLLPR
jgi:hypothetical protein